MSAPSAAPTRRIPGEVGTWVFVLSDMVVFAVMFGVLIWLRNRDPAAYAAAQSNLHVGLGAVNTVLLLTSSLLVALGVRAARAGQTPAAPRLFAGALGCALAFVVLKAVEYSDLVSGGHSAHAGDFYLYFFTFTGTHLLHVLFGAGVLTGVIRIARRAPVAGHDRVLLESGASYWHMVDLLWLALFALFYLVH